MSTTTRATVPTLTDLLFENSADGLCLVAPDGTVLRANAEWLRSTGLAAEQVLGEDIVELFPDREATLAMHARAWAGHRVLIPRYARTLSGRETWWEGSIDPVPMEGGTGLLFTAREVGSAERAADDAARLAAEVLEHGDGVFVLDSDFRFVLVNAAFERASGLSRESIRGRVFWDLFPLADLPESPFFQHYRRAMCERVALRFEASYPARETWNEISVYPTRSGGIAVFFRDITKRHNAEAALAREEEKYRGLFQHSVDAVYLAQRDGTILDANPAACRLHGMTLDELKQAGRAGIVVLDERHAAALQQREANGSVRAELAIRRKDGTTVPVEVESVVLDGSRPDSPAFVITRDITRRKRAQEALVSANEKLREVDRRKDEFLAMLSHELRNPLAPIRNSSYILRHAAPGSEQARRAQAIIERQTEHITRLVDDLLDVTRIARSKIELRRERIDLREVVSRAAEDFRALLDARDVTLHVELPDSWLWADADATRISQAVGNLLHNARKFTRRGDSVSIALVRRGEEAELRVRDTGAGIEPRLLPTVFDPFVQGERTLARSEGGLGLGLALVKGIVEMHGGSVRADSAGMGRGAEFILRLPLVSTAPTRNPV